MGCLAAQLMTGRKPFAEFNQPEVVSAKLRETYDLVGRFADLPEAWQGFVGRLTEWDPQLRTSSARDARRLLSDVVPDLPDTEPMKRPVVEDDKAGGPLLAAPPAPPTGMSAGGGAAGAGRQWDGDAPKPDEKPKGRYEDLPTLPGLKQDVSGGAEAERRRLPAVPRAVWMGAVGLLALALVIAFVRSRKGAPDPAPPPEIPGTEEEKLPEGMSQGRAGLMWIALPGAESVAYDSVEGRRRFTTLKPFELARTETTVAQYRTWVAAGGGGPPAEGWADDEYSRANNWAAPDRSDHPINAVDWKRAHRFCTYVGGRLPTEAEWDFAARGGKNPTPYPWGEADPTCNVTVVANAGDGCGTGTTAPVCAKQTASKAGGAEGAQTLCDMAGNVAEWTADWVDGTTHGTTNAPGTAPSSATYVTKGTDLASPKPDLGVSEWRRARAHPKTHTIYTLGFRCARDAP